MSYIGGILVIFLSNNVSLTSVNMREAIIKPFSHLNIKKEKLNENFEVFSSLVGVYTVRAWRINFEATKPRMVVPHVTNYIIKSQIKIITEIKFNWNKTL